MVEIFSQLNCANWIRRSASEDFQYEQESFAKLMKKNKGYVLLYMNWKDGSEDKRLWLKRAIPIF